MRFKILRSLCVRDMRCCGCSMVVSIDWLSSDVSFITSASPVFRCSTSFRFLRSSASFLRISMTFRVSTSSGIASRVAVSLIYTCRLMISGIIAIDRTICRIISDRLVGSFCASSLSNWVLKRMKSWWLLSKNACSSFAFRLFAKLSGSSPSGKRIIRTFKPSSSIISIPRSAALIPALSPS